MLEYKKAGREWYLGAILNKQGRMEFSYYDFKEGRRFHDVPWRVKPALGPRPDGLLDEVAADLIAKVSAPPPPTAAEVTENLCRLW
jgi:hypothetical protein